MAEPRRFRAIRGVRDILPPDTALWNWFERTARDTMESYGFREIRLPIFEQTELFRRSVGADTDMVSKEMYSFPDPNPFSDIDLASLSRKAIQQTEPSKEGVEKLRRSLEPLEKHLHEVSETTMLTLRPEATASVVRAYIEHEMHTLPGNVKLYYSGPMFRRERPQRGRYRQFYQIGAEVLGPTDHPAIDAELIEMLTVLLERCRIEQWTLWVNSIGSEEGRREYIGKLRSALEPVKSKMCADCQRRAETNPLRVFDCKVPADQPIIEQLPTITDHLDPESRAHFEELQGQLRLRSIPYTVAPRLVRGLDYYTRTTFEITSPVLGAQNALLGGGRYDGLSELLGGRPTKGIGFALGEDRLIDAIRDAGKVDAARPVDVFIAWIGPPAYPRAVRLARRLRSGNLSVEVPPEEMKLKKSLGLAHKLGARYAVLLGESEISSGVLVLRRMADGEQKNLSETELLDFLNSAPVASSAQLR